MTELGDKMNETEASLATIGLDAAREQLEAEKAALESAIGSLKAGRDEAIAERALSPSKERTFNRHIDQQLSDLEFELRQTNDALARNAELRTHPAYVAAQEKRASVRAMLNDILRRLKFVTPDPTIPEAFAYSFRIILSLDVISNTLLDEVRALHGRIVPE